MLGDKIDQLPATPADKPLEQWTDAELLGDTGRQGILQARRIIKQPFKVKERPDDELTAADIRQQRVIADTGLAAAKLAVRAQEAAWRADAPNRWAELLAKIEAHQRAESSAGAPLIEAEAVTVDTAPTTQK